MYRSYISPADNDCRYKSYHKCSPSLVTLVLKGLVNFLAETLGFFGVGFSLNDVHRLDWVLPQTLTENVTLTLEQVE